MLPRLFQIRLSRNKMKNMLESFEKIIHPQYGNALYFHNAFIRYQTINNFFFKLHFLRYIYLNTTANLYKQVA